MITCWGTVERLLASEIAKLIHLSSRGDVKLIIDVNSKQLFILCLTYFKIQLLPVCGILDKCYMSCVFHKFMFHVSFLFYNFISLVSFQQDSDNTNVSPQSPVSSEVQVCGFVFHSTNISLCSLLSPGFYVGAKLLVTLEIAIRSISS